MSLRQVSARLGSNPALVQANTGNTSVKDGSTMWIKKSGASLADAARADMFAEVNLRVDISSNPDAYNVPGASIETAMHAMLPWRAVLHVHSLNVVSWAVRQDGCAQLSRRLSDLPWAWIPYVDSGLPLGYAVKSAWASAPATSIFILANHGLVVCGETCESAEALLFEVERRLATTSRHTPAAHLDILAPVTASSAWRLPESPVVHALAMDRTGRSALRGGVLYPCQAIFFGRPMPVVPPAVPLSEALRHHAGRPMIIFENAGVVVSRDITPHQSEMLTGLAQIATRLEPGAPLRYLRPSEIDRLGGSSYLK